MNKTEKITLGIILVTILLGVTFIIMNIIPAISIDPNYALGCNETSSTLASKFIYGRC